MAVKMTILSNREEWLKNRFKGIGGSEASAIVGMNPYMTNVKLWQIKVGQVVPEDISDKAYVKYGTYAEEHLRALFGLDFPQYQVEYVDNNSYFNDKYPFALASLDGVLIEKETGRKGILEIKTTEILQSMQREKWNDKIPDNYYIQVLHYLMVTEYEFVVLKAQLKTVFNGIPYLQIKHYFIERKDVEDDIQYLADEEKKFWKLVQEKRKPDLILPEI